MTVTQIELTMSYSEFLEWQKHYNEEPFLADRLEMQLAKIGYSNLATAFGKIDIGFDYFLVSQQNKKENNMTDSKKLELDIKKLFGG